MTKDKKGQQREPYAILPSGSYFGDYHMLRDKPCFYSINAIGDDEIKTYAPENWYANDATFTTTIQEKYLKRRDKHVHSKASNLISEMKEEN